MDRSGYGVMVLSAGESRRMGYPKALLDVGGGECFLSRILGVVGGLEPPPACSVVVLGFHGERILNSIDFGMSIPLMNRNPERGMLSSILTGISYFLPESERGCSTPVNGVLMTLVDHPLVSGETYGKVLEISRVNPGSIVIPVYAGRRGHPVFFPREIFQDLMNCPPDEGARWAVRKNEERVILVPVEDPHIRTDIDTPEIYCSEVGIRRSEVGYLTSDI